MPAKPQAHKPRGYRLPARAPDQRASAARRGYDQRWQRVRLYHLLTHPLCEDCNERGRLTLATQVHHVVKLSERPDLRFDHDNLLSLCSRCHSRRTRRGE